MLDPHVDMLGQSQWISGQAYPSPVYVVNAPLADFGTPFKVASPAIRGVTPNTYSAPVFTYKANQALPIRAAHQRSLGALHGAAPTAGVYTGIPSGCTGGNPYS